MAIRFDTPNSKAFGMLATDGPHAPPASATIPPARKKKTPPSGSGRRADPSATSKRRCISTACIACRRRKSKCNGALPSCAACASVYGTECVYDPNSDHRRKGVYKEKIDSMKAQSSTLQILVEAILNAAEDDVPEIVKRIRTCDSLDTVAEAILKEEPGEEDAENAFGPEEQEDDAGSPVEGERDLARKMGELRVENGSVRYIGGTSALIYLNNPSAGDKTETDSDGILPDENPTASWTEVTKDTELIDHLMNMYFNWHYPYFTTLSKSLFLRDYAKGRALGEPKHNVYCSSLLVNAMLALGCHFTDVPGAYAVAGESQTKGDHFAAEAKRLILENDEYEKPRLTTVQALALMSVREAGCAREAKGWVYSGMAFRMAQDLGLNLDAGGIATDKGSMSEQEIDARRISFWGCFLFDKCWSNYLGRLPQIPRNTYNVPKFDVFPDEDAEQWSPYRDAGFDRAVRQPSRTRAAALQLSKLCEISSDLLLFFYHPNHIGRSSGRSVELKKLSELHRRLEDWKKELPPEFEPKEGQLPNIILMLMFYRLQYLHLFRPFLKYAPSASPLPAHVSPRRICTAAAMDISKLMRLYKKTYNLRQICNIAVYMEHQSCTIHLLNLPDKMAKRDIIHGVKHLEEIAGDWLCARRALSILSVLARKWKVELPEEAALTLQRSDERYGTFNTGDVPSPAPTKHSVNGVPSTPSPHPVPSSPPTVKEDPYQAAPQYVQQPQSPPPHLTADLSTSEIPADLLSSLGMSMQSSLSTTVASSPLPINDALPSWTLATATSQPALSGYPTTASVPAQATQSRPTTQPQHRNQNSVNSLYAIDGEQWYIRDGVNWHQNFESWGLPAGANTAATTNGRTNGNTSSPSSAGNPDMFVFQGIGLADLDANTGLDGFWNESGGL